MHWPDGKVRFLGQGVSHNGGSRGRDCCLRAAVDDLAANLGADNLSGYDDGCVQCSRRPVNERSRAGL